MNKVELTMAYIEAKRAETEAKAAVEAARRALMDAMSFNEKVTTEIGSVKRSDTVRRAVNTDKVRSLYEAGEISRSVWERVAPRTAQLKLVDSAVEMGMVEESVFSNCFENTDVTSFKVTV